MEPIVQEIKEIKQIINNILAEYSYVNKMRIDCTKAILDCWELVDFKNQYPNNGIAHHTYQDIANNQADLIKKIRDILDPIVQKIYTESTSSERTV